MRHGQLNVRLTHKYVDEYKHLDQFALIGDYLITSTERKDVGDMGEFEEDIRVIVYSDKGDEEITKALSNEFGHWGCSHEYDCCGCRLVRVTDVEKQDYWTGLSFKSAWYVKTFVTRNY